MQAFTRAADRGVAIRIYLDGTQLAERKPAKVFDDLARVIAAKLATVSCHLTGRGPPINKPTARHCPRA